MILSWGWLGFNFVYSFSPHMHFYRHAPLENGIVPMELSVFHNTFFAIIKPIAMMAVMKSVISHHVRPFQQCSHAKMEVSVWLLSRSVMAIPIVTMGVTRHQMSVNHVLRSLGGGCVQVGINVDMI